MSSEGQLAVLCRANTSPFWKGWQHNRAPLDEVEYHLVRMGTTMRSGWETGHLRMS